MLWDNKTAAEATGGKAQGTWQALRVEIDSRRIQPGDLFVALKGDRFDGHEFVAAAFEKGAAAAVVSNIPSPVGGGLGWGLACSEPNDLASSKNAPLPASPLRGEGLLLVPDTLKALEQLGVYARNRCKAKIVGVTGSVGKTSAKEMLKLALAAHGATYATSGNFNNHIGTPLNLANLPPDARFAVFEMGMNHAGEISHLTRMVRPHIAAITNVEAVHMEFFASVDAIAEAKAEIFEGVAPGGIAVLNRDNGGYPLLAAKAKERGLNVVTFGEHLKAHCRLIDYGAGASGCAITAEIYGMKIDYTLAAVGRHWALASLLVLAVMHALGLDDAKTAKALADFAEPPGRGRIVTLGSGVWLIDDSYNASPASMRAAFAKTDEVWKSAGGRKIAALGDMLELGPDSARIHAELAAQLEQYGFDGVFTAGDLMQHLHDALPEKLRFGHAAKAEELLPALQKKLRAGDILLVKGSHGSNMYRLANKLQDV